MAGELAETCLSEDRLCLGGRCHGYRCISVLDPIARAIPETAKRVKDRIAKVLDWAYARDLRSGDNPARRPNLLPKNRRAKVHFAAMAYPALPAFLQELRQLPDITARALELLILTAARPNEVLGARWGEIDLASAMWTIPGERMKSGKRHRVPLSGRAVELLAALPRESDYVFMGRCAICCAGVWATTSPRTGSAHRFEHGRANRRATRASCSRLRWRTRSGTTPKRHTIVAIC
jgi:integrase